MMIINERATAHNQYIGQPLQRVVGPKKVSGQATYAAEFDVVGPVYGYVVESTIANGNIQKIDTSKALEISHVLAVYTHENLPEYLKNNVDYSDPLTPPGHPFRPLFNGNILYNGQPIALVVAETFEVARYAAGLVEVTYGTADFIATIEDNLDNATREEVKKPPKSRGDAAAAFAAAPYQIDAEYTQPRHYHNPMEPHASTVVYEADGTLTIYDKVQGVASSQIYVCGIFGLKKQEVRVISPFVGGGFGAGLRPQYQLFMAVLAATELKRSAKVVMTRRQMYSFGHRPANIQKIKIAANEQGKLTSIQHHSFGETSTFEFYSEGVVDWSGMMYQCKNVSLDYQLIPVQAYTPMDARGPGGTTGLFALETAMDELALVAGIDPLDFRLRNYAERDQNADKPFSSKALRECYQQCAERFGWSKRNGKPSKMQIGNELVGYGMATGSWEAFQQKATVKAHFSADGKLTVSTATADNGTGTYTVMSQIAADTFGIAVEQVDFKLGDTKLTESPIQGGSWTVSSVGSAVKKACVGLQQQLLELAKNTDPDRFGKLEILDVNFTNGEMKPKNGRAIAYAELLALAGKKSIATTLEEKPKEERDKYSCYSHACVMVEVRVDKELGTIRIPRVVNAAAAGKIINPKMAENQLRGATVWGIGMALGEEGMVDKKYGRIMNANLAEYHVPVNADIQDIDIIFVEEKDDIVNPLGAKGVGELGIVGVAAAVSNAVFNATGKRIRQLPITLDKLL